MTNDELKKKILEIFEQALGDWYEKDNGLFAEGYTPEEGDDRLKDFLADALIAAGIGDVKEAELRAEVAERAFSKLVHEMYEQDIRPMCDEKFFIESRLKDAEKELAEERKDGNKTD